MMKEGDKGRRVRGESQKMKEWLGARRVCEVEMKDRRSGSEEAERQRAEPKATDY